MPSLSPLTLQALPWTPGPSPARSPPTQVPGAANLPPTPVCFPQFLDLLCLSRAMPGLRALSSRPSHAPPGIPRTLSAPVFLQAPRLLSTFSRPSLDPHAVLCFLSPHPNSPVWLSWLLLGYPQPSLTPLAPAPGPLRAAYIWSLPTCPSASAPPSALPQRALLIYPQPSRLCQTPFLSRSAPSLSSAPPSLPPPADSP